MTANNEFDQTIVKTSKKSSKSELIPDITEAIIEVEIPTNTTELTVESSTVEQETKIELKKKLSGLVHPSRIKTKKPQKLNVKLIGKIKKNPVNFF